MPPSTTLDQVEARLADHDRVAATMGRDYQESPIIQPQREMVRILRAAKGNDLTSGQRRDFGAAFDRIKQIVAAETVTDSSLGAGTVSTFARAAKSYDDGSLDPEAALDAAFRFAGKSSPKLGRTQLPSPNGGSVSMSGRPSRNPDGLGARFIEARTMTGFKSLLDVGSTAVPMDIRPDPIADPRRAKFVYQLLGEELAPYGVFSYLAQTTRTNNAAVVASGALKPTSVYTLTRTDDRLKVIAHLSEPIDRFDIEDAPLLQQFLESEMSYGLDVATDGVVVTAILAAATDAGSTVDLAAIRGAITTLEEADLEPNAIVLSPSDWADVEAEALVAFAANSNLGPNDAFQRRLYGISVTVTTSIATGKAIIGDFGSALLYVDDKGVRIDVSSATPRTIDAATVSDFELNQLVFRAEKRAAVAVTRPTAFVKLEP